jgi:phosphatidylinositol dimannoside acyltransferase
MHFSYYCFCLIAFIARFIPLRLGYFLAGCGGDVLFLLSKKRRQIVGRNILRAKDQAENNRKIRLKVRHVFRNAAKNYLDLMKMSQINWGKLDSKVKIEGMHHLTQAVNNGKGVIIATAHLGNFEFGAHVIASRGVEMVILVEAFDTVPLLRKIVHLRRGKGVKILSVGTSGMKEGLRTLRRGGTVTIVCDRDLQGNGMKIPFLGQETSFPVGAVDLALRTGAAIVPVFSLRKPHNKTSIFVEPPITMSESENHHQALKANLERLVATLEKYIRKYPEQWVVLEPV